MERNIGLLFLFLEMNSTSMLFDFEFLISLVLLVRSEHFIIAFYSNIYIEQLYESAKLFKLICLFANNKMTSPIAVIDLLTYFGFD